MKKQAAFRGDWPVPAQFANHGQFQVRKDGYMQGCSPSQPSLPLCRVRPRKPPPPRLAAFLLLLLVYFPSGRALGVGFAGRGSHDRLCLVCLLRGVWVNEKSQGRNGWKQYGGNNRMLWLLSNVLMVCAKKESTPINPIRSQTTPIQRLAS